MIIAGNWKMNMDRKSAAAWAADLITWRNTAQSDATLIVFPPAVLIDTLTNGLADTVMIGGQDCHIATSGAHTGDIAAPMLHEAGCRWVLVGHSERRQDHGESSQLVSQKAKAAIDAGLTPIICVGEQLSDREAGRAYDVVAEQVTASLPDADTNNIVIAYEPVWAIGTGKVAGPDDVAAMHDHIHNLLTATNPDYQNVPILYGGSVKPDNAAALLALDHVGGALIGGASLNANDFIAIASSFS